MQHTAASFFSGHSLEGPETIMQLLLTTVSKCQLAMKSDIYTDLTMTFVSTKIQQQYCDDNDDDDNKHEDCLQ